MSLQVLRVEEFTETVGDVVEQLDRQTDRLFFISFETGEFGALLHYMSIISSYSWELNRNIVHEDLARV